VTIAAGDDAVSVALIAAPDEDATVHVELTVVAGLPDGAEASATVWLSGGEAVNLAARVAATGDLTCP
jgi:hypothetical protein